MASGTAVFRWSQSGAERAARDMSRAARAMRSVILAEMRSDAPLLEDVFASYAPYDADERDDYHLQDNIEVRISAAGRIRATVYAQAVDPRNGFDYLRITRFGHRGVIRPQQASRLAWRAGGVWHSAAETAGSHPPSDWVEDAQPEADTMAGEIADRVGRVVYTRLLS